uniref:C-type lectin domain-containing protein n=1 Tax=Oryzias latipes TaxID=8090 RepID=A0A3B3HF15_ORYLA
KTRSLFIFLSLLHKQRQSKPCNFFRISAYDGQWCPEGWRRFGSSCYYKSTEQKTWTDSRSFCQKNGSDLVLLVLNVKIAKSLSMTVVGCYRPPSATKEALSSLKDLLSRINYGELLMVVDLNWDWSSTASEEFKSLCESINLSQLISQPTRPNTKCPEKSTLI